jgi:hypothetical protein
MMNDAQCRWTLFVVIVIGAMCGLYTTLMVSYFIDALPSGISPWFLVTRLPACYLGGLALVELCWYVRWQSLACW